MKGTCWLGIDIGASKLLACAIDGRSRTLGTRQVATRRDDGAEAVFERVVAMCRALLDEVDASPAGTAAGFAGLCDRSTGTVRSSIMLPGWDQWPLAARLEQALGAPAQLDNDATLAGLGEYRTLGSPPGLNMVVLTVGTGIGGALILDGRLYRGSRGLAGELGNTSVHQHGPRCWCGAYGCLNTLASGSAIATAAGQPDTAAVAAAAQRGDARARQAIADGARALGTGIANFVNIFDPDRIALCGGVTALGDDWLQLVREEARARAFAETIAHVRIERSQRGLDVGAFGAACLCREQALAPRTP